MVYCKKNNIVFESVERGQSINLDKQKKRTIFADHENPYESLSFWGRGQECAFTYNFNITINFIRFKCLHAPKMGVEGNFLIILFLCKNICCEKKWKWLPNNCVYTQTSVLWANGFNCIMIGELEIGELKYYYNKKNNFILFGVLIYLRMIWFCVFIYLRNQ